MVNTLINKAYAIIKYLPRYWLGILICLDQLLNFALGGEYEDETFSSRCYRWHRDGQKSWPRNAVNGLFFWQKDHCKQSYESERDGRHLPPELR